MIGAVLGALVVAVAATSRRHRLRAGHRRPGRPDRPGGRRAGRPRRRRSRSSRAPANSSTPRCWPRPSARSTPSGGPDPARAAPGPARSAQARAYAIQRYMYGSADSRDLLAFLAALDKPADDAVWGLATLEVTSEAALDQAQQVAKASDAVEDRLAAAESDVLAAERRPAPAEPRSSTPRPPGGPRSPPASTASCASSARPPSTACPPWPTTPTARPRPPWPPSNRPVVCAGSCSPPSARRSRTTASAASTSSATATSPSSASRSAATPTVARSTGTLRRTTRSVRCSSSPRPGSAGAPTPTATAGPTPGNIVDAATAAGRYLCRAAGDLTLGTEAGRHPGHPLLQPQPDLPPGRRAPGSRRSPTTSPRAGSAPLPSRPPPAPVADLPANAGPGGRAAAGERPAPPPPPTDDRVADVRVFGAAGPGRRPTTAPVTIEPTASASAPSLVLDGRAGFLRCRPGAGDALLDPCEHAPYDATLVGCLPDPTGTPSLLRLAPPAPRPLGAALAALPAAGARRRRSLPAHPRDRADPAATTAHDDHPHDGRRDDGAAPSTSATRALDGTTTGTSTPGRSRGSTTTTATTAAAAAAAATSGPWQGRTRRRRPRPRPASAQYRQGPDDLHLGADHHATPTTTIPLAERPTYTLREQGDRHRASRHLVARRGWSSSAKTGLADRQLVVVQAFS